MKMTERYDCHYCKESLFGKKYVPREENPYCVKCYESLYSNTCEECKKPIGCNTRVRSTKEIHRACDPDGLFLCIPVLNPIFHPSGLGSNHPSDVPVGSVLQGPSLARGVLHVLPVQAVACGQALLYQGRKAPLHRVLLQ